MEKQNRKHPISMFKILLPFLFTVLTGFGQSIDSLHIVFYKECDKNFSSVRSDSTFCNFYIKDYKDTVYFRQSRCLVQAQTSSPVTFKHRIQNGYASGFIRFYMQDDESYTWLDGHFSNGYIGEGSYLEYYHNGSLKLSGQYFEGHRNGVWTWYFENGRINRVAIYKMAEPIKEMEYDSEGNLIEQYDFVEEKIKAGMN